MNSNDYEIKINDFPSTKIYILLNERIRISLIDKSKLTLNIKSNYDLANWLNKKSKEYGLNRKFNGGDVKYWIIGNRVDVRTNINHPKYIPLWVILELSKLANISLEEINKYIISYRSGGRGSPIYNPKLPIKITPEFESIVFHIFGDGAAGKGTPSFAQKNDLANKQFISKLKNCFGEPNTKHYYNIKTQVKQTKFPKAIIDILSHFYNIGSYHSDKIRIPLKIYKTNKLNKLACISAFILDEGNIRDIISISSKNRRFLLDLKKLIESCGYNCKEIKPHKPSNSFYLNLSNSSIEKFYNDYLELIKQFPTCSLANKHDKLVYIISRRKNKSNIINIDRAILELFENNSLTTSQISEKLGFANCTILHHLEKLHKDKIINRINHCKGFDWFIKSF